LTLRDRRSSGPWVAWVAPLACLLGSSELVYYLTRQRIVARYRGSWLGVAWALLSPALNLAIFTLVFGVIFEPRWTTKETDTTEYALLLYLGLCAFWFVSECVAEAPGLVVQHSHYVKKVVFPLEILSWVSVSTASFHAAVRLLVFVVADLGIHGHLPLTLVLLPLVWLPLGLMALGLSWLLAAVGVFARDLGEVVALGLTATLFLSPVFYPIESVPESFRWLIAANPLTLPITQLRAVAYFGVLPDLGGWLVIGAVTYAVAVLGHAFFMRSRRAFPDVL
jgi:lipopolysaccharide transport system permease protein